MNIFSLSYGQLRDGAGSRHVTCLLTVAPSLCAAEVMHNRLLLLR